MKFILCKYKKVIKLFNNEIKNLNCFKPISIDNIFILGKLKEENKIQKIDEFEIISEKNKNIKNKNYKFKNFPLIKKNIIYQIKKVDTFQIIKKYNSRHRDRRLPVIKKALTYQMINQLYIPGINNHEEDIEKVEESELVRIFLPIPEFVIEDINDFVLYALKKNPLLIQNNTKLEFKPKK